MATFRRSTTPGATYFFTVTTHHRQKFLTQPPYYQALKAALRDVKRRYPFTIDAFVLLPDHLHCIWTLPEHDADYSTRWNIIKRQVSQQTRELKSNSLSESQLRRNELGFWQRRFWEHQIRDDRDFEKHVEYIHWNPVKHGCVKNVKDWPYSSFHRFVERGVYPSDWGSDFDEKQESGGYGE